MWRVRLRSPLRWLSALTGSLLTVALAGILGIPLLALLAPVVAAMFLLAPAIGIYRHDETPVVRTGVYLDAREVSADEQDRSGMTMRFRLALVNPGDVPAEDIRIRLLLPHSLVPPDSRVRPLAGITVGEYGKHWAIESAYDATAVTFRTAPRGAAEQVICPPRSRQEIADLVLPAQRRPVRTSLDYQISGGNAKATLGQVELRSTG